VGVARTDHATDGRQALAASDRLVVGISDEDPSGVISPMELATPLR
jgi:hypothetical protein